MATQPPPPAYPGQNDKSGNPPAQGQSLIPPPSVYQPMYGQPVQPSYTQSTVIMTQPVHVTQQFREVPVRTKCQACHAEVLTSIHFETGTFTWVVALILCLFGLWLGCCLIPMCVNGCKDVVHSCPNCRHQIGRYNRM